ncbi:MAG: hypothetical protein K1000chlam2_00487 [Chlamydiae bacterium]|nr:hypothetical protein [Chlamydiota bacterium]
MNIFRLFLFAILFICAERFCHKQTHGFRLHKIHSSLPQNPQWETPLPTNEACEILQQPFHFLNSGGECYVFVSQDGDYVLKFFKHHHMRQKSWIDPVLPQSLIEKRRERLSKLFTSCKIAYERFSEGTGLVYLHLTKTDHLRSQIRLFDPIGVVHTLNLDEIEFVLQKRATLAYSTLTALIEAREFEAAKRRLESLVDLIASRSKAGIADHDARKRNFGFIGSDAIELDLGSFSLNESLKDPQEAQKAFLYETMKLRRWIKKYHPELSESLDAKIKEHLI